MNTFMLSVAKSLGLNEIFKIQSSSLDVDKIAKNSENKPYQYNVWVYACVDVITKNLVSVPKYIYDTRADKKITDHPILDLFKKPNPTTFGTALFNQIATQLLLNGQVFILPANKEKFGEGQIPREMFLIDKKYLTAMKDTRNLVSSWAYKPDSEKKVVYENNQVIRLWFYNPYDETDGLSPLDAARLAVITDARANAYNANFFDNHAALGGVLKTPNRLNEPEAKKIATQFKEAHSGADKAGSVAMLHSGLEFQSTTSTHKDMQWEKQVELNKDQILAAFHVPKNMVSDYADQNYSNSLIAQKSFWEENIIPLDNHINELITYQWVFGVNPYWEIRSDYSKIEALQAISTEKVSSFSSLSGIIPREESARILNIPIDWDSVEELEKEDEVVEVAQQEEAPQEDVNVDESERALKGVLNKYFTALRNKMLDKVDSETDIVFDVDEEYLQLAGQLKEVYISVIKDFLAARKAISGNVDVRPSEIVGMLNDRSKGLREHLDAILKEMGEDKASIHERFQSQYAINKEIAHNEIEALYKQVVEV